MKTFYLKAFFILLLILCNSCHRSSKDKIKTYEIKVIEINPRSTEEGYLSSHFDSIFYLPLVTSDTTVIGSVRKLEFYNDKIFITDGTASKVHIFTTNGSHILTIGKRGRGPGEFNRISEASVDTFLKRILIFDFDLRKELSFDFSGNLIAEKENQWWISEYLLLDNSKSLIRRSNSVSKDPLDKIVYKINLLINGQKAKGFFPYNESPGTTTYDLSRVFTKTCNKIYIGQLYNDTIYLYEKDTIKPELIIKYLSSGIPETILRKKNSEIGEKLWQTKTYAYGHQIIAETESEIFITFIFKNQEHYCFFSKSSGEPKIYSTLKNDIDGGVFKEPIKTNLEGYLVSVIYPYELKETCEKNYNLITGKELKKICENIKITDNPVLMFCRMKK